MRSFLSGLGLWRWFVAAAVVMGTTVPVAAQSFPTANPIRVNSGTTQVTQSQNFVANSGPTRTALSASK